MPKGERKGERRPRQVRSEVTRNKHACRILQNEGKRATTSLGSFGFGPIQSPADDTEIAVSMFSQEPPREDQGCRGWQPIFGSMDIKTYGDSMTERCYKWARAPFCELFGRQVFHFGSHRLAVTRIVSGFAGTYAIIRVDSYSDSQGHDNLILTAANVAIATVGGFLMESATNSLIRSSKWVRTVTAMGDNSASKL